jgi:pimeloyl-ACP methyl ester carboxylesterase
MKPESEMSADYSGSTRCRKGLGSVRLSKCVCLVVIVAVTVGAAVAEQNRRLDTEGVWLGILQVRDGPELRVVVEVFERAGGTLGVATHSPDQGKMNITIRDFSLSEDSVRFQIGGGPVIQGHLAADGSKIEARLGQLPLVLEPVDEVPGLPPKPQTPRKPYPYKQQDIVVDNKADNVKLSGTLTTPRSEGPFPAVVLASGSGQNDRNGTNHGHFLLLADYLTRHGIAVLRYDKRGVMRSTGDFSKATMDDFTSDLLACVLYLRSRRDIDSGKVGLLGHSEGAIVSAMAAAKSSDVAFVVMMGGSGINGFDLMVLQDCAEARARGATDRDVALIRDWVTRFYTIVRDREDVGAAREGIQKMYESMTSAETKAFGAESEFPSKGTTLHVDVALSPWFRKFIAFDPQPALRKVRCPVLALVGGRDAQVPPKENARGIAGALHAGGNEDFAVKELRDLNHLFQTSRTGAVSEYDQLEEIIAPEALVSIAHWIMMRTGQLN